MVRPAVDEAAEHDVADLLEPGGGEFVTGFDAWHDRLDDVLCAVAVERQNRSPIDPAAEPDSHADEVVLAELTLHVSRGFELYLGHVDERFDPS